MTKSDWIKVGIIARSEFPYMLIDTEIHMVKDMRPYPLIKTGTPIDYESVELIQDEIVHFKRWRNPSWDFEIGIGYSKTFNTLAICTTPLAPPI